MSRYLPLYCNLNKSVVKYTVNCIIGILYAFLVQKIVNNF